MRSISFSKRARFSRVYRSQSTNDGPLGYGWDANVFMRLEELPGGDVRCFPGNGRSDLYESQGGGAFTSPVGLFTRLVKDALGFLLRSPSGFKCPAHERQA